MLRTFPAVSVCHWALALLLVTPLSTGRLSAADPPVGVLAPGGDAIAMTDEVKSAVAPLFKAIHQADSLRVTAEMRLTAAVQGETMQEQTGTYRVVSATPNRVSALLKGADQESQMVSDGEHLFYSLIPGTYIELPAPQRLEALSGDLETPFGPFPEYILSLSLAGVDAYPAYFRTATGMGVSDGEREELPGTTRIHVRRGDGVVWDLWVRGGDSPAPVRLAVDLTGMLVRMNQVQLPEGFTYVMELDFKNWETNTEIDEEVFHYEPKADAEKFTSLDAFIDSLADESEGPHPLVGQSAPPLETKQLDGSDVALEKHRGKHVVVLDFWATWCGPCIEALPLISKTAAQFADQGVVFYAVNVGEEKARIQEFLKQQELDLPVLLDPEGQIASAYGANAIPQTVLIGKDGRVEVVHVGFGGAEEMEKTLTEELTALVKGQRLAPEPETEEEKAAEEEKPAEEKPAEEAAEKE
ncbi:redoxin domain-containing protein [Roseimaritima sediminicola]|uniref:redoxin domain-containing protein n=1 Tax=Roseimaritima sediminicola TaxID=2662066 RepID=UPI001387196D|nr:redoxin domain-containing protein [Roseimaritima sediminicola]